MAKNTRKAKDLEGMSVYQTGSQTVYYDRLTKKGYIILNDDVKKYTMFQIAYPLVVALAAYLSMVMDSVWIPVLAGICGIAAVYLMFRLTFLHKLPVMERFVKPEREGFFGRILNNTSKQTSAMQMIISGLVAYLLIANAAKSGFTGFYLYFSYIVSAAAGCLCVLHLMALIRSLRRKQ